ncbi:MAG TPA: patatin-like phospholipase family protein [Usitatibacter sp.]|jgi:NTE family protein|nr:patatin-like phospholipase family protein [Usitatibacter sp.]
MRALIRTAQLALVLALAGCYDTAVAPERMPRYVAPSGPAPRVALVLGSGGPRGFAHIGVLKALDDAGIKPDLIVGSSVGAMVGALYCSGISGAELEKMAYQIKMLDFFEFSMLTGKPSSGVGIQRYVDAKIHGKALEQLGTPMVAIATRLSDRQLVMFNHGDAGLAVRASSASPGQFDPVRIGNDTFVDGDETSPVPIRIARKLGARVVIAVDVSAFAQDTPPGVPQAWVDKDARRARQVAAESPLADVVIHPNIGYYAGESDSYRHRVIGIAEDVARNDIPRIRTALARAGIDAAHTASTARIPSGDASR